VSLMQFLKFGCYVHTRLSCDSGLLWLNSLFHNAEVELFVGVRLEKAVGYLSGTLRYRAC
jgi:hypothetical protein